MAENDETKIVKEVQPIDVMINGVSTYAEIDAMEQAEEAAEEIEKDVRIFPVLANNIMRSQDEIDKPGKLTALGVEFVYRVKKLMGGKEEKAVSMKTEGGIAFPAADFAYVPDPATPSTWKLRLSEGRPGNITIAQLGRAAAAFSSGGFRGNKVQIPEDKVAGVKTRIRNEYKKLNAEAPASVKSVNGMMVYKEKDTYYWIANYSNNFRDDDNPSEIISSQSHKNFVKQVSAGVFDLPELQIWHEKSMTIGKAIDVMYDEHEDGSLFALAYGYFFKGMEPVAEALSKVEDLKMSHGMPGISIKRDQNDPSIIIEHQTKEISVLPGYAAANRWTQFNSITEEKSMTIPVEKREAVKEQLGIDENVLQMIEANNSAVAAKNLTEQIEMKQKDEPAPEQQEQPVDEKEEQEVDPLSLPATRKEVIEAVQVIASELTKSINERFANLELKQKSDEEIIAEKATSAPAFSIAAVLQAQRASQSETTKMKQGERSNGPVEAKDKSTTVPGMFQQGMNIKQIMENIVNQGS